MPDNNRMINVPYSEYKNLLKLEARVEAFANYVNGEQYSISRKSCGILLGFEVADGED